MKENSNDPQDSDRSDGAPDEPAAPGEPIVSWSDALRAESSLGNTVSSLNALNVGALWTTVLPEPTWLSRIQVGLRLPNVMGSVLGKLEEQTTGLFPIVSRVNEITDAISRSVMGLGEPWGKLAKELSEFSRKLDSYPDEMREGLIAMSRFGWYLDQDMEMSDPIRFKRAVDEGREVQADTEMVEYFDARIDGIRTELIQAYSHRQEILDAAFDAHSRGQYLLSIPVLLAQVDGICFDVVDAHFFMGRERPEVLAKAAEFADSQIARAFLAPLEAEMSIALSEKARPPGFAGLNRHMVLHGESIDYGTKENGLRAISLLNYIAQSLEREISDTDEPINDADPTSVTDVSGC
ncbi:hypothetical protein [Burkholderia sp. LMG 21824]|uniref:hypothetical protein n=1 Tax=Burkholderia sp. LMG 21824 TaxID=3158172 RepID=UPI003C2C98F4